MDHSSLPRLTVDQLAEIFLLDTLKGYGPQKAKSVFLAKIPLREVINDPRALAIGGKTGESLRAQLGLVTQSTREECIKRAEKQLEVARACGSSIITYDHPLYPKQVFESNNAVPVLYVRGNIALLSSEKLVACVGSREIRSPYSESHRNFATTAVEAGYTVVSGFATGADTIGHRAAVLAGGRTICVMPGGLDRPFPPENKQLWEAFLRDENALFVSEFGFGIPTSKLTLQKRNKLIVGFSQGVLVSQSSVKGGAMNAYRFAKDQKKQVATFVHDESDSTSGNRLIASDGDSPGVAFNTSDKNAEAYSEWLRKL